MLYDLSTTLKCNILCYDYSGYGYSTGTPSESEVYNDIEEVGYFIKEVLDIDQTELILLGHSLGSAPTVHLATKKNYQGVAGVALIAPLASGMSMILKGDQAFTQTKKDVFDNKKKMLDIDCPIFLIHGKKDNIIPYTHSIELSKFIKNIYKWFPTRASHNNILTTQRLKFYQKFKFFIDYLTRFHPKNLVSSHKVNVTDVFIQPNHPLYYMNIHSSTNLRHREENYMSSPNNNAIGNSSTEKSDTEKLDIQDIQGTDKDKSFCSIKHENDTNQRFSYSNYLNISEYTDNQRQSIHK